MQDDKEPVKVNEKFIVVGYLDKGKKQLATSINPVVKIMKEGVITAQGTFYPFEEAHELYLQFLIEVSKENTLIAKNWEFVSFKIEREYGPKTIIADIIKNGNIEKGVTFDVTPNGVTDVMLSGYSKKLSANVVLTTFAKRNVCIILDIPQSVEDDIYNSSFAVKEETMEKVRLVRNIFIGKLN